ncbi:hypothetical protein X777_14243 [Ooceraea biroi]|uniref:Uncharacterized protein n=1 Tax=Ooceraea biroi TaxID=2015173 RepID=A0A026WX99_OOCBI|nr:hypothetical protein X777_14243 [Ooceraea biroi]
MKMRPTANLDESVTANRSVQAVRYTAGHPSRFSKEQISDTKNAQTEYETHLSQNAAHSSTYGPSGKQLTSQNWYVRNRERHVNSTEEGVPRNLEKLEQKHKGVGTCDIDSPRRYHQSGTIDEKSCAKLYLWCVKLCHRKRECSEHVLGKPTRRLLERMKKRSKECEKPDETTVASVSAAWYPRRDPISPSVTSKPKRSHKQDELVQLTDVIVDTKRERKKKERRKKEKDEREGGEEEVSYARDEDFVVEDRIVSRKAPLLPPPLLTDFTKSCCYLCAQNTLAITAATTTTTTTTKPEQSDKYVQVSAHKLRAAMSPELDKSCSPLLLVHVARSSVKVRTRETSTLCPGTNELRRKEIIRVKKRNKFGVFPGLTRNKCPAGRHAACETDKTIVRRDDNARKCERRNGKCCREKDA